jgi:hypothetical protein
VHTPLEKSAQCEDAVPDAPASDTTT